MNAHLLFKFHYFPWDVKNDGVTIDLHQDVIKKNGKVWWGRTSGVSQDRAEAIKNQIKDDIPTYAFLYGINVPKKIHADGVLWYRAKVHDVVLSKPKSEKMIPAYYADRELEFYTLISDIEEIKCKAGTSPKVPGQAAIRHVSFEGKPIPENLTFLGDKSRRLCWFDRESILFDSVHSKLERSTSNSKFSDDVEESLALKVIDLQEELIQLKDEIAHLKTYKDYYSKILNTDYLFSSEKFFETWIQENMHRIFPELDVIDRQPNAVWPDGKFGRLDLLAINKENRDLVIVEVKTRKRSKSSGYDQYLRYTSWAKRNLDLLSQKYKAHNLMPTTNPQFIIISDYVDEEMKAICKDHGITLVHIFGGLGVERAS